MFLLLLLLLSAMCLLLLLPLLLLLFLLLLALLLFESITGTLLAMRLATVAGRRGLLPVNEKLEAVDRSKVLASASSSKDIVKAMLFLRSVMELASDGVWLPAPAISLPSSESTENCQKKGNNTKIRKNREKRSNNWRRMSAEKTGSGRKEGKIVRYKVYMNTLQVNK